jgi:hypothetical protein
MEMAIADSFLLPSNHFISMFGLLEWLEVRVCFHSFLTNFEQKSKQSFIGPYSYHGMIECSSSV